MLSVKVIQCSTSVSSITARVLHLRRSDVKEILQKYKQFSQRKTLITPTPSRLLLGGTFLFKSDLSVSEVVSGSPVSPLVVEKPRGVVVVVVGVVGWLLETLRLLLHCLRTLLVFSPLLLSSPLILLPPTLRPSALLLDLLGQGFNGKWIKPGSLLLFFISIFIIFR